MISGLFSLPLPSADAADPTLVERTAEAFVAGPENALVRSLAADVSRPIPTYNPLVLCGSAGVGKSALAHALVQQRSQQLGLKDIITTTGIDLARGLADAIETGSTTDFRTRHQRCDLLLIDDVQRLADRSIASEFLIAVIDALVHRGALVIATLRQLDGRDDESLLPRLTSRLSGGLVVQLNHPGPLARRELAKQFATRSGLALDDATLTRLAGDEATSFVSATRLRHTVMQLAAVREIGKSDSHRQLPRLAGLDATDVKAVCQSVTAVVAKQFQLPVSELKGKSRRQAIAEARSLAMYLVRRLSRASYSQIGDYFGNRDHTTALHACRKVTNAVEQDDALRRLADELAAQISATN